MSGGVVSGREALAERLAEHEADVTSYDAADIHGCRCGWELTTEQKRSENYGWGDFRDHVADALLASGVVREEAGVRAEALREAADEIRTSVSSGFGMRPDGSEDPLASAYVEGLRDAYQIVTDRSAALAPQDPA